MGTISMVGDARRTAHQQPVRASSLPTMPPRLESMLLDLVAEALLVLDLRGRIIYRNAAAKALLAPAAGVSLVRGVDRSWRVCDRSVLEAVHEVCTLPGRSMNAHRVVVLPAREGGARLVLRVQACGSPGNLPRGLALVRLHAPAATETQAVDVDVLRQCFDLTTAEADVALALMRGLSPVEISCERGVSRTTTAFHLRNLFAKTHTRRQAELVRCLLAHAPRVNRPGNTPPSTPPAPPSPAASPGRAR